MKEDIERITQELQIFDNSQSFASLPEQFELIPGIQMVVFLNDIIVNNLIT